MIAIFHRKRFGLVTALSLLGGIGAGVHAQTVLFDFGNNTSFRGLSVPNPDTDGNYWNSFQPGLFYENLIDSNNNATMIDFGFDTPVGTDSYNGPAGATSAGTLLADVTFSDVDAAALGILGGACDADAGTGTCEGVFDFAATDPGAPVRFQIQALDPTKTYNLTFFGSHKYSTGNTTTYNIYTDETYTSLVDTATLNHQDAVDPFLHNRDMLATISGVAPQASNILYVEFVGDPAVASSQGYLNVLQLEVVVSTANADYDGDGDIDGRDFLVWQRGNSPNSFSSGDLAQWQLQYGTNPGLVAAIAAVPEPSALCLLIVSAVGVVCVHRPMT